MNFNIQRIVRMVTYGRIGQAAKKRTGGGILLFGISAILLFSCSSLPDLSQKAPSIYFKAAETARFQRKRRQAIELYKLIQLRFADNFTIALEAEFSIGQIYFSWNGHDKEAKEHYQNVIQFYERPEVGTDVFPLSYRNLAQKNLQAIKQRQGFRLLPPRTDGVKTVYGKPKTKNKPKVVPKTKADEQGELTETKTEKNN
ncbi:hypothetical protein P0082_10885 [Candidatus Haliotispira prima]|uniref:Tetratricopeptide repeat protein n=1 Tax=Candidatus Haliotispira prima TaxID=3034016 RepID=A0ABY8MG65_9SPIO|nr:hypothetical protein P0082_10885 [Candidatus Haliotispira prima]